MDSLFLSVTEVAELIGKPKDSFRKWWKTAPTFPRPHPDFKQPKWRKADIEAWAESKPRKSRKRQEPESSYLSCSQSLMIRGLKTSCLTALVTAQKQSALV